MMMMMAAAAAATWKFGFLCFLTAIVFLLFVFTVSADMPLEEKPNGNVQFSVVQSRKANTFLPNSHVSFLDNFFGSSFPFNFPTLIDEEKIKSTMLAKEDGNNLDTLTSNSEAVSRYHNSLRMPFFEHDYPVSFPSNMLSSIFDDFSLRSHLFPMRVGPTTNTEIDEENQFCVVTVNSTNLPDSSQVEVLVNRNGLITINYLNSEPPSSSSSVYPSSNLRRHDDAIVGGGEVPPPASSPSSSSLNSVEVSSHHFVEVSSSNSFLLEDRCNAEHEGAKSMVDKNQGVIKLKFPLKTSSNNSSVQSNNPKEPMPTSSVKVEDVLVDVSKVSAEEAANASGSQNAQFRLSQETSKGKWPRVLPRVRSEEF